MTTLDELQARIVKIATSSENATVKELKIQQAFAEYDQSKITLNPDENTGDPNAPEGLVINTKGELEGDLGEDKPAA